MSDLVPPAEPASELDPLIEFMSRRFPARQQELRLALAEVKELRDRGQAVRFSYELISWMDELGGWIAHSSRLVDTNYGDQVSIAHADRASEAAERKSTRPSAELVKSQAEQFTAPLRAAKTELELARSWSERSLSFMQSQLKSITSDEYGDLFSARESAPDDLAKAAHAVTSPPSAAVDLRLMKRQRQIATGASSGSIARSRSFAPSRLSLMRWKGS